MKFDVSQLFVLADGQPTETRPVRKLPSAGIGWFYSFIFQPSSFFWGQNRSSFGNLLRPDDSQNILHVR